MQMEPCLCGHAANSYTSMKRHRRKCEVWKSRDKNMVARERYLKTVNEKYGVNNVMELESVQKKIADTCLDKYGDISNLGKKSTIFYKVQKNNKIQKYLNTTAKRTRSNYKTIDYELKDVKIRETTWEEAKGLLDKHHYGKSGRNPVICYGGYLNGTLIEIIKFATVVRKSVATSLNMKESEVLELDRMCVSPEYRKKNLLSYSLKMVVRDLKAKYTKTKVLVSFADPYYGHSGSVYKASNWKYIGVTSPSYIYIDIEGNVVNKKSVYNRARKNEISEKQEAEECNYVKVPVPPKHKFILPL